MKQLDVLRISFNGEDYFVEADTLDNRRDAEISIFEASSDGFKTRMTFDQLRVSQLGGEFSLYTTLFVISLLIVSIIDNFLFIIYFQF